jgi:beta-phosphoglucomutase-like phosphatase (HAD superfamily)
MRLPHFEHVACVCIVTLHLLWLQVDANLAAAGFDAGDFDAIVSANGFAATKPAPDIFLAAAQLMGVKPENCVVIEDAAAGIQAAHNAGENPGSIAQHGSSTMYVYRW